MNALPKLVATTTLETLEWNATKLEGDVVAAIRALKQDGDGMLLTYGSAKLVQTLLRHGLVDELRLLLYPLLRGRGKRLFSLEDRVPLQLTSSEDMGAGVILLTYTQNED